MSTYNHSKPVLDTYQAVVSTFTEFLTVAFHTILYERNIYPRTSFLSARKYNYPVRQNRHPKVCQWIQDAVAAVETEMLKSTISTISLVIHSPPGPNSSHSSTPLERFVFATTFPHIPPSDILTPFAQAPSDDNQHNNLSLPLNPTDLSEQFRALLSRLSHLSSTLLPLPENCSFTIAIEVKEGEEAPIGRGGEWVVALPGARSGAEPSVSEAKPGVSGTELSTSKTEPGTNVAGPSTIENPNPNPPTSSRAFTTALKTLKTGPFTLEMWIEEGRDKQAFLLDLTRNPE